MRYLEIEVPANCPYRLYEAGKWGCGFYTGYAGARKSLCNEDAEFPAMCPLGDDDELKALRSGNESGIYSAG